MMSRPGATGMSPSYGFSPGPINILMPQRNRAWQTCFEKPTPECLPSTHPSICRYTHERLLWRNATCWLNGDVGREAAGAIRQVPAEERPAARRRRHRSATRIIDVTVPSAIAR